MTKYSTDFKINAVQRYCKGNISLNALAAELKLS
ncbi:transposase, partial [Weissella thailandensis]